jgi:hypothetical protein
MRAAVTDIVHVGLAVADLDSELESFTTQWGLRSVHLETDQVYLAAAGSTYPYTLRLRRGADDRPVRVCRAIPYRGRCPACPGARGWRPDHPRSHSSEGLRGRLRLSLLRPRSPRDGGGVRRLWRRCAAERPTPRNRGPIRAAPAGKSHPGRARRDGIRCRAPCRAITRLAGWQRTRLQAARLLRQKNRWAGGTLRGS